MSVEGIRSRMQRLLGGTRTAPRAGVYRRSAASERVNTGQWMSKGGDGTSAVPRDLVIPNLPKSEETRAMIRASMRCVTPTGASAPGSPTSNRRRRLLNAPLADPPLIPDRPTRFPAHMPGMSLSSALLHATSALLLGPSTAPNRHMSAGRCALCLTMRGPPMVGNISMGSAVC